MRLATRTEQKTSTYSSGWNIHSSALERIRRGEQVILLTVGDSDFPSPPNVVAALEASIRRGRTHYTESAGTLELRSTIARRHTRLSGQTVEPSQVIVSVGAQNALLVAALCLLDPGDEVIVPEPMYSTYPGTLRIAGAKTVNVSSHHSNGFHPRPADVERAVTDRTKAIFMATPNNPTGAVYTRQELEGIADVCQRHDLWLVSDEVYASLVYDGQHMSPCSLPGMEERTITLGSLSKSHAMAGWRLGWMIAPPAVAAAASTLSGYTTYGIATFIQDAAFVALESEAAAATGLKEAYERRRQRFCQRLSNLPGLTPRWPEGGMFVMLDVRRSGISAQKFAEDLLSEENVAVLPADAFGPSSSGFLRVNLGAPDRDLEEAAERMVRFLRKRNATGGDQSLEIAR